MHVQPQGGEKNLEAKFTGKIVSAPQAESAPPHEAEQESILRNLGVLNGGRGYLVCFSVCYEGDD